MGKVYDDWGRLVGAVVRREKDRQLCLKHSRTPSEISSASSSDQLEDEWLFGEALSWPDLQQSSLGANWDDINDGIPRLSRALSYKSRSTRSKQVAIAKVSSKLSTRSKQVASAKVSEVSSMLGRVGTAGLGKAVGVLDTLGSSMTNLNLSRGFASRIATKGIKISILAFEVANTIVKGANLMHSLSDENIRHLKEVVLPSEGVQRLISTDMDELLSIAAFNKRHELKIFFGGVIQFGNLCNDPIWHNLDRYFDNLRLELELTRHKRLKKKAETDVQQLMVLVQYTAELYHDLLELERFEQYIWRKEEDNSNPSQRGDSLALLRVELKSRRKYVRSLKKKSLWGFRTLEEVTEKLVDIVHFLHLEIHAAFGSSDENKPVENHHQKLGSAGLALHYANIITQVDTLVTRSNSMLPSTRDSLYQGLPPSVKSALRSELQSFHLNEELTVPQIKAEMEKTLQWLVPMATNTTKAHHGFGWVGEWANTWFDRNRKPTGQTDLLHIETLHHADKDKTEAYILDLVVWLHHLISQTRAANGGIRSPVKSPIRFPNQETLQLSQKPSSPSSSLTVEDQEMLGDVSKRKLTPGISKSQVFDFDIDRLSKSSNHSPTWAKRDRDRWMSSMEQQSLTDIDWSKALDVIDGVDPI